jgi:hypothetical protein
MWCEVASIRSFTWALKAFQRLLLHTAIDSNIRHLLGLLSDPRVTWQRELYGIRA